MLSKTVVVEDEQDIAQLLAITTKKAGLKLVAPENGHDTPDLFRSHQRGLLVLDLMIPGIDGLDLIEEIDRAMDLELGVSNHVVNPLNSGQLLLRLRVVLGRTSHEHQPHRAVFKKSGLEIHFQAHQVSFDGRRIDLTAVQFKLLAELVNNQGKVLSREYLLDKAWGYHFEGYMRTVDTHVSRLRQKLPLCADWIETVRGVGYRFLV